MTSEITFATLESVDLRTAWPLEARNFTPWLAENLDRIALAIEAPPLELVGTEVPVGPYRADILARDPTNDTLVLIENQLAPGDHGHLGQILTYLTGLGAHTVIWVAEKFREEHLSAIRWLNLNTIEPFAFFAVTVRVVRIANSPYAPLFEVVERPNAWDRRVQETARETREGGELTELGGFRRAFWTHLLQRHPSEAAPGRASAASSRWRRVETTGVHIAQYVSLHGVGVFVRGPRGQPAAEIDAMLRPHEKELSERLGAKMDDQTPGLFFERRLNCDSRDPANWDRMADWLADESARYVQVLSDVLRTET